MKELRVHVDLYFLAMKANLHSETTEFHSCFFLKPHYTQKRSDLCVHADATQNRCKLMPVTNSYNYPDRSLRN